MVKTSRNLLFAYQDDFNNLWLLLHCFQKFAFSVKTIHLHDIDIIAFSNLSTLKTVFKSLHFHRKKIIVFDRFHIDAR